MPAPGEPTGAFQVGRIDTVRAVGLGCCIDFEQDVNSFPPVGALGIRIQKAQVKPDMRQVIGGRHVARRRSILLGVFFHRLFWQLLKFFYYAALTIMQILGNASDRLVDPAALQYPHT